jgi:membrane protein required for colicin V production
MPVSITWLDLIIAIILVINALNGLKVGFIRSLFSILAIAAGVYVCINAGPALADVLVKASVPGLVAYIIVILIVFVLIYLIVYELGKHVQALILETPLSGLDRTAGVLAGCAKGIIYCAIVLTPLTPTIMGNTALSDTYQSSSLIMYGQPILRQMQPLMTTLTSEVTSRWSMFSTLTTPLLPSTTATENNQAIQAQENAIISNF